MNDIIPYNGLFICVPLDDGSDTLLIDHGFPLYFSKVIYLILRVPP